MKLFPFQEEDVTRLQEMGGRGLLASDPGCGKTAITINYFHRANLYPYVVVCPSSVKGNWKKEIKQWTGKDALVLDGSTIPDVDPDTVDCVVVNYDIIKKQIPFLYKVPYKAITFDEAHYLGNKGTDRTKLSIALSRRCAHAICLSGTPIENTTANFWPVLHIIRPQMYPNFGKFAWEYCAPTRKPWGWDFTGSSNIAKLHKEIKPFTIRRLKKDVLTLPKRDIEMVPLDMENDEEYREADADFLKWLGSKGKSEKVEKAKKAEAITKMNALMMLAARHKARATVNWCRDYLDRNPDRKMIIFASHTQFIDVLYRRVAPGQSLFINGSVPSAKRTQIVEQFQTDDNIRVIVGNMIAMGAGLTLTAARAMVFAEIPWKPSTVNQAQDRNYRIGTNETVEQFFLVVPNSIEAKLCEACQRKQNLADSILEGKETKSMDLLTLLKETLQ